MFANNVCTLSGRVGQDPTVTTTNSGTTIAELSIAVNRFDKEKKTDWVRCKFFGKTAETVQTFVRKGSAITVLGSLRIDKYETNSGEKKEAVYIIGENVQVHTGPADAPKETSDSFF